MDFLEIEIIKEFENKELKHFCGVYSVIFKGKKEIFVRNGNSIGAICFFLDQPIGNCLKEIRDDVKKEFLKRLDEEKQKNIRKEESYPNNWAGGNSPMPYDDSNRN